MQLHEYLSDTVEYVVVVDKSPWNMVFLKIDSILKSIWKVPRSKRNILEEPSCKRVWCFINLLGPGFLPLEWFGRVLLDQVFSSPPESGSELRGLSKTALVLLQTEK